MKRTFFVLAALFCMVFSVSGQNSGPVDLILVLDTSSSMSGSYREVNDYLTGPFLREFLRIGDTFHLVPFAGEAFVDVSRRVEGQGDVQTILSRIFLAYPMGPESDVEGALSFAEQYASTLPASRGKKIVLVTDGGNVPSLTSLADAAKRRLEPRGVSLDLVPVPLAALPSSNRPGARSPETRTAAAGRAAAPSVPSAPSAPLAPLARTEVRPDGVDAPAGPSPSPAAESPGAAGVSGAPGGEGAPSAERGADPSAGKAEDAAPDSPAAPYGSPVTETAAPADRRGFTFPAFSLDMFPYIAGLVILVLLILGLILFIAGRDLHGSPNRAISRAASARPSRPAEPPPPREPQPSQPAAGGSADLLTSYAASQRPRVSPYAHRYKPQPVEYEGPLMLNLFVEDQNTAIGKRNIHAVKQGYTFTVGGGKSDFLIFLVPVPPHIGEIRCDGNNCTFIPKKPNYFPDTGSQQIPDCIGKMVRVVSDKNYELHFRMERYEDPLRALNRLLRSVSVPG